MDIMPLTRHRHAVVRTGEYPILPDLSKPEVTLAANFKQNKISPIYLCFKLLAF